MSATSLQIDIVSALDSATTAGRRVYYGTRLQTSLLPAITFEISTAQRAALGSSTLCVYEVTFNAIGEDVSSATALSAAITSTLGSTLAGWVLVNSQLGTVQEPLAENGDEAGLYIVTSNITFYQQGP